MDEVEVCVHTTDDTPCDRPPTRATIPYCGHGFIVHEQWVPAEPPC